MEQKALLALGVLALTYVGIMFTRLPHTNLDRPAAALVGGVLMVLLGVLTFDEAAQAIDVHTIALLLGMMLLVGVLQRAGFFTLLAGYTLSLGSTPLRLLAVVILATGVGSAFLVNDVVVLLFTPVVVQACRALGVNPVPYLIAEAMASNIGSTATIVGNPQNMLIGVASGIPFGRFFVLLAPVAVLSGVVLFVVVWAFYRKSLRLGVGSDGVAGRALAVAAGHAFPAEAHRLLWRSVPILLATIAGFFLSTTLGIGVHTVALVGGTAAVVVSGVRPSQVIQSVDWTLLVFFAGLFVVIGGAQKAGLLEVFLERLALEPNLTGIVSVHLVSTVVSQIVSNVPLTMLAIPLLKPVGGEVLWLSLAAGSTLGGNATLIGAVANIIVAEVAARDGAIMGWWEFTKVGLVVTVLTVGLSMGILALEWYLGLVG
ncbi:MAG: SLC13 family permease [Dehalococcoidia bacterium]|nr:SLC13 family permease [Dehalococcoidia bacterium]MDW8119681.1 SLC13 family permease [Chloroflexota bacterium]